MSELMLPLLGNCNCTWQVTSCGVSTPVLFTPMFVYGSVYRGTMEPVVMWYCEDDNHSGRLNNSDQHCDHPSLRMEHIHLWRWPQAEVPLLPGAEERHWLPEVGHLMNTLCTSAPRWTTRAITSSVSSKCIDYANMFFEERVILG